MGVVSKYWIQVRIDSFGRYRSDELEEAKTFFNEQFPGLINKQTISDRDIQSQLMQWYQSSDPYRCHKAEICLLCLISSILKEICIALDNTFAKIRV